MKKLQITDQELIKTLRRMAPEACSLICMGCGHEYGCSIHGCSVLRMAADRLTELSASPPNPPLTLEELREMDGEPVWCCNQNDNLAGRWGLIWVKPFWRPELWNVHMTGGICAYFNTYGKTWLAYRRKPEEGKT